jgi:hypothetical protein
VETLGQKQRRFLRKFTAFLAWGHNRGYEFTYGEAYRTDEQAEINALGVAGRALLVKVLMPLFPELARRIANNVGNGIRTSLHGDRLAVDVNLFHEGEWINDGKSPHWKALADKWEAMGADHKAGSRFGDAGHFSISHEGKA